MATKYLAKIDVIYGDSSSSEPPDAVRVVDANNGDINAGFKGKYVWLVPRWSYEVYSATSNIRIIIQDQKDPSFNDLAQGAGGKYRYLRLENDGTSKITEVKLLRRSDKVSYETIKALGFHGYSGDINEGRGGDYLHLVWNYH